MSNMTAEIPREKLKELVQKNGDGLLQDPDRCEGLLKDHCGSHRREISALVGALEERVPMELKSSWQTAMTPEAMRARLVQRLEENRGLAPDVANWAVDAWSYALGVGLGRSSDRVEDGAGGGMAIVPDGNTSGPSIAERVASDRPGGASVVELPVRSKGLSIAQMSTPRKAGFGAGAALLLGVAAFALIHHPTPVPGPTPPGPAPAPVVKPDPNQQNQQKPQPADQSDKTPPNVAPPAPLPPPKFLPAGTVVSVRLDQDVSSETLNIGDTVPATVSAPVTVDGNVIVSTGAKAKLKVTAVENSAKDGGAAHLQLALADLSTDQGRVTVSTNTKEFNGPTLHMEQAKRGGVGAAVGAAGGFLVGHIFHHGGAGAGAGAAAGGTVGVVTAKAQPVKVTAETAINFRISTTVKAPHETTAKK